MSRAVDESKKNDDQHVDIDDRNCVINVMN